MEFGEKIFLQRELESSSIDKCFNFPSRSGKEKFHRFFPRIVNLLFEKWRGLNWSRNERLKICRHGSFALYVLRPTRLKVKLLKINENSVSFFFFFLMKSRAEKSRPSRIDFRRILVVSGFSIFKERS